MKDRYILARRKLTNSYFLEVFVIPEEDRLEAVLLDLNDREVTKFRTGSDYLYPMKIDVPVPLSTVRFMMERVEEIAESEMEYHLLKWITPDSGNPYDALSQINAIQDKWNEPFGRDWATWLMDHLQRVGWTQMDDDSLFSALYRVRTLIYNEMNDLLW